MERIIARCGLVCTECPAYMATQRNDDVEKKRVAELWMKEFGGVIRPEDIDCDGCQSSGRAFKYCNECEIRKCGADRGLDNCAHCDDFACERLGKFFDSVPDAKKLLESIRNNR